MRHIKLILMGLRMTVMTKDLFWFRKTVGG